jgi:hypothetical protein
MKSGPAASWQRPRRSPWAVLGIALAVVLAIGGLVIVGMVVILFVGLSQYGSNK